MELFRDFNIRASGLTAERLRMDLISNNIANANTTRTKEGGPYQRQIPIFGEVLETVHNGPGTPENRPGGVKVLQVTSPQTPPRLVYDPSHPDANGEGYVAYPDINVVSEMVNLISASRAYEANITAFNAAKDMFRATLDLGRR